MQSFLIAVLASLFAIPTVYAQDPAPESTRPKIQVQVLVVGQSVPPRYEIVKRVKVKGLRGDGASESTPDQEQDGVPLQIAPEPDELPPSPLYIKTGKSWTIIPVRENCASPKVAVPATGSVVVAIGKENTDAAGKKSVDYKPVGQYAVAEGQDSMLVVIIKDPRQPLKWSIIRTLSLDTSWARMPSGSVTVFNASFLPIRGQVGLDAVSSVPVLEKLTLKPKSDESGQVPYYLEVQHPDQSWNMIVNTSTSLSDGGRILLVPYGVVLPETNRFASVAVIRDFKDQGGIEAAPEPASSTP